MESNSCASAMEVKLKKYSEKLSLHLDQYIKEQPNLSYSHLFKAARYSIFSGGKRLRPILTLATTEMLKGNIDHALPIACAIEMIHTFSLIHDDLPGMDNDDLRRGRPTLHKVYREGLAILTGDFLLNYAFEVIANAAELTDSQKIELIKVISYCTGSHGMIGGQVVDIESEGKTISYELLQQMDQMKTGALFVASLEAGAIIAQASNAVRLHIREFGWKIGLAFQIVDDILDVNVDDLESQPSSDIEKQKATYVSILGLEGANKQAERLLEEAFRELKELEDYDTEILKFLAEKLVHRNK